MIQTLDLRGRRPSRAELVPLVPRARVDVAVLVTDDADLGDRVIAELDRLTASTAHAVRVREALDGRQSAIVLVDDIAAAAAFSNAYGPEHLELHTAEPGATLDLIENAGAIFLGADAPVSLGDYLAGSNHVLPTGGQSRFAAGLGAATFLRSQQVIRYEHGALAQVRSHIRALSDAEQLPAHGDAVDARFPEDH